jgi:uncharacterized membrane protein
MTTQPFMDEVIRPHRSLPRAGFIALMAVMTVFNVGFSVVFAAMGAGVVPLFMIAVELAALGAFWASYRSGERFERVRVTAVEVRVTRHFRRTVETVWLSPVEGTDLSQGGPDAAPRLQRTGQDLTLAEGLSPRRRAEFAEALDEALRRARSEVAP